MRLLRRGPRAADHGDHLLVAAAQYSPTDFTPLFDRYWDAVLGYCLYRLDSREDAEDAASQVFVDAFAALDRFCDHDDSFRAWLFTIAHHEVADRHRHRTRHPDLPLAVALDIPDPAPSPEEAGVLAGDVARTRAMLVRLPNRPRRVAELRLAGLTDREIARVLGISGDAVRQAQSRAVAQLRVLMGVAAGKGAGDA